MTDEARNPLRPVSGQRINEWLVLLGPEFEQPYEKLRAEVGKLWSELPPEAYRQHTNVKLFAAIRRFILEVAPANPNEADFMLKGDLAKFRRGKGHGIPDRYRIIWAFSSRRKVIIFLYLNDETSLRKAEASTDPYEVFRRLLRRGQIGPDFEANYRAWLQANSE